MPSHVQAVTAGADQKLVLTSDSAPSKIIRVAVDGTSDATFASGGTAAAPNAFASVSGIAADGTGYLVGSDLSRAGSGGAYDMALFRYTASGALDSAFGTNGIAKRVYSGSTSARACVGPVQQGTSGWVVACGLIALSDLSIPGVAVVRFLSNGAVDTTFGSGGETIVGSLDSPGAIAVQADGKVVIAGTRDATARAVRLDMQGAIESTFNNVDLGLGKGSVAAGIAVDVAQRIVIVGTAGTGAASRGVVVRLTSTGSLDATFGLGGVVRLAGESGLEALILQPDGAAVVGGWGRNLMTTRMEGLVLRYLP